MVASDCWQKCQSVEISLSFSVCQGNVILDLRVMPADVAILLRLNKPLAVMDMNDLVDILLPV